MDGKGTDQNQWDEHLDTVLLTYRVLPIDGLDVSPFEIIYGRGPNLPIDNILFRENYTTPVQTLEEYLDMLHETQLNMYEALNLARKERFERNKKNSSQTPPRLFKPGDKVYLSTQEDDFGLCMVLPNCHASTTDHLRFWVICFKDLSTISNTTEKRQKS